MSLPVPSGASRDAKCGAHPQHTWAWYLELPVRASRHPNQALPCLAKLSSTTNGDNQSASLCLVPDPRIVQSLGVSWKQTPSCRLSKRKNVWRIASSAHTDTEPIVQLPEKHQNRICETCSLVPKRLQSYCHQAALCGFSRCWRPRSELPPRPRYSIIRSYTQKTTTNSLPPHHAIMASDVAAPTSIVYLPTRPIDANT